MSEVKKRGGYRTMAVRLVEDVNSLLLETAIDVYCLEAKLERLHHFKAEMMRYDEIIQDKLEDQHLVEDMQDSSDRLEGVNICIRRAERVISQIKSADPSHRDASLVPNTTVSTVAKTVKLPVLHLPYFKGDSLEWPQFWDAYESAVHEQTDISGANKFAYLMGQLKGEAFKLLEGFSITNVDYDEAIQLLRDTYGQPHKIILAHLHAIFDLKRPEATAKDLSHFRSSYECHIRSLKNLGANVEGAGFVFAALLLRKLPDKIRDNINRASKITHWDLPSLRSSINAEIEHLMAIHPNQNPTSFKTEPMVNKNKLENVKSYPKNSNLWTRNTVGNFALSSSKEFVYICKFCFDKHASADCIKYVDPKLRLKRAKELNLCTNCLVNGHIVANCRSVRTCQICHSKHNTALCFKRVVRTGVPVLPSSLTREAGGDTSANLLVESTIATSSLTLHTKAKPPSIALPTASLSVVSPAGIVILRALFDQGSQKTLMLLSKAEQLRLVPTGEIMLSIDGFASEGRLKIYQTVTLLVQVEWQVVPIEAVLVERLPSRINMAGLKTSAQYLQTQGVVLADKNLTLDHVGDVSVLVGSDYYYQFVQGFAKCDDIILLRSLLGDMISGPIPDKFINLSQVVVTTVNNDAVTVLNITNDVNHSSLDNDLQNLWKLDIIGISPERDISDNSVLSDFTSSLTYTEGRYTACLPWKSNKKILPSNFYMVRNRLYSNLKKLRQTPEMLRRYDGVLRDYESKGFIERVDGFMTPHSDSRIHYLAHHSVEKISATTPLRIVFDCSAGKPSLNDCLFTGPTLLSDLTQVLLRFRLKRFAAVSDITKAYLMITLHDRDRDATRFLWPEEPFNCDSPLITYRFKVVIFGATCSQFILNATILHHLRSYTDRETAKQIQRNLYVDNLQGVADNELELMEFYYEARSILGEAGLRLAQWATNSGSLRSVVRASNEALDADSEAHILGMKWDFLTDSLKYPSRSHKQNVATKREIVQQAAKIYDPLGYLTPVLIRTRMFIQELWKANYEWDEVISDQYVREWQTISEDISASLVFSVPRRVVEGDCVAMHAFSDASSRAYGAAIYFVDNSGNSNLVMSKARVAPLKKMTIPQLELTASLLAARLVSYVLRAYGDELTFGSLNLWSDSQIVLHWICKPHKQRTPYIQSRIDEIHNLVPNASWRYVPSSENPSDLISRGVDSCTFLASELWLHGPIWLTEPENWPVCTITELSDIEISVSENVIDVNINDKMSFIRLFDVTRFSKFKRVVTVTALVFRFIRCLKGEHLMKPVSLDSHNLSLTELKNAECYWVKQIQGECFHKELAYLESPFKSAKPPNLVVQLNLFLDIVIRCRGRLDYADLPEESKYPILLPSKHHLTKLIIQEVHVKYHGGVSVTVNCIRQRWWFPKMRQQVRSVLRSCVVCKRFQGQSYKLPNSGPLPPERVKEIRPFQVIGVDYTGALLAREGKRDVKVYVILFTCAVTRGIHLELVYDNTAASFILAFKRFIGRRSCPNIIYSDNSTTFRAASSHLEGIYEHPSVKSLMLENQCEWKFIPARSPWFGGFWERLIGLTKTTMKKILGRSYVNCEELRTIIVEIEGYLNDRPLTYVSDDLHEGMALTPSQLMIGYRLDSLPSLTFDPDEDFALKEVLTNRQKRCQELLQHFWGRWRSEYLAALRDRHFLQERSKKKSGSCEIAVGDIVLIEDDGPRLYWHLGKIQSVFRGNDGKIRSAVVKTANHTITRAIARLYPLEISGTSSEDLSILTSKDTPVSYIGRPVRNAAKIARGRIKSQLQSDDSFEDGD